jgi:hypothetical protein
MAKNQNQRARIIIHHRRGFRAAQEREILFQIRGAMATPSPGEPVFKIVVLHSDSGHRLHDSGPQRRTAKVRVNENAGAINHRLDAGCAQDLQCGTQLRENFFEGRYRSVFAQGSKFLPDCRYNGRMRQSRIAQRLREFVNRGDSAKSGTHHAITLIFGLLDGTI